MELKTVGTSEMAHVDLETVADTNTKRYVEVGKQMERVEVIFVNSTTPNHVKTI